MIPFFSARRYVGFVVAFFCMGLTFHANAVKTLEQAQAAIDGMIQWPDKLDVYVTATESAIAHLEAFKGVPLGGTNTFTIKLEEGTTEADARQFVTGLLTHGALSPDEGCAIAQRAAREYEIPRMTTKFMQLESWPGTGLEIAVYGDQEKLDGLLENAALKALVNVTFATEAGFPHILTLKEGVPFSLSNKLTLLGNLLAKTTEDFVVAITTLPDFDAKGCVGRILGTPSVGLSDAPAPIAAAPDEEPAVMDEMTYQKELVVLAKLLKTYEADDLVFVIEGADQVARATASIAANLSDGLRPSLVLDQGDNKLTLKFKPRTYGLIKRKILLFLLEQELIQRAKLPEALRQKAHDLEAAYAFRRGYERAKKYATWLVVKPGDDETTREFKRKYANPPRIKKTADVLQIIVGALEPVLDPKFPENGAVLTLPSDPPFPFAHLDAAQHVCHDIVRVATTPPENDLLVKLLAAVKVTHLNQTRHNPVSAFPKTAWGIQYFLHHLANVHNMSVFSIADEMPHDRVGLLAWAHEMTDGGFNYARVLDPIAAFLTSAFYNSHTCVLSEREKWDISGIQKYTAAQSAMEESALRTKGVHAAFWSALTLDWSIEYLGTEVVGLLRRFHQSETVEDAQEFFLRASVVETYNSQHARNLQHLTDCLNVDEDYKKIPDL